jgi:hypothetical protein
MVQIALLVVLVVLVIFVVRQARFVLRPGTGDHAREVPRSRMYLESLQRIVIRVELCLAILAVAFGLTGRRLLPVELQAYDRA